MNDSQGITSTFWLLFLTTVLFLGIMNKKRTQAVKNNKLSFFSHFLFLVLIHAPKIFSKHFFFYIFQSKIGGLSS